MTPPSPAPMPPEAQQLLEQMHGIITPTPVSWWPPAPGWWVLAVLLIAGIAALTIAVLRYRRRTAYKRAALSLFDQLLNCADQDLPSETNRLLKRVALTAFPSERTRINQLFGDAWVEWLNGRCTKTVFTGPSADALASGGYKSSLLYPRDELLTNTRRWLLDHKRGTVNGRAARV